MGLSPRFLNLDFATVGQGLEVSFTRFFESMADPFEAENDDEWSQWFAALHDGHKAKAIKAVTGESNEFSLRDGTGQNSNITHLPHRLFNESRGLTSLDLCDCTSLAALPESLGQLQALTTLYLSWCESLAALPESLGQLQALTTLYMGGCFSLAGESVDLARRLLECNERKSATALRGVRSAST